MSFSQSALTNIIDFDYLHLLTSIRAVRGAFKKCTTPERWLRKLVSMRADTLTLKLDRNIYLSRLLAALHSGVALDPIFNTDPPEDILPALDAFEYALRPLHEFNDLYPVQYQNPNVTILPHDDSWANQHTQNMLASKLQGGKTDPWTSFVKLYPPTVVRKFAELIVKEQVDAYEQLEESFGNYFRQRCPSLALESEKVRRYKFEHKAWMEVVHIFEDWLRSNANFS